MFWVTAAMLTFAWLLGLAISVATDVDHNATREMLEGILKEEDGHVNDVEESVDQVDQMAVQNFLATQVREVRTQGLLGRTAQKKEKIACAEE